MQSVFQLLIRAVLVGFLIFLSSTLNNTLMAQTKKVETPQVTGDVAKKRLDNAWMMSSLPPRDCGKVTKEMLPMETEYSCLKSCGERSFFWISKKAKDRRFGYAVPVQSKMPPSDVADLDLEPLAVVSVDYNESAFVWFDKTVIKYLREALKCDSSLTRTREPDFLTPENPEFSRSCPGATPERISKSHIQAADKADKNSVVKPYARVQFSDSRGYEIELWSLNKMNLPRLANDLAVHRLSRCPL